MKRTGINRTGGGLLKRTGMVLLAAFLIGGLGISAIPVFAPETAFAAEDEKKDDEPQLPKGPQNELEIMAKKKDLRWPKGPDALWSDKAILMDMDTGVVLYEKNADVQDFPASTTKIMTAMLVLENSEPDEVVTFSKDSVNKTEGSGIWRVEGEKLTVEQCMYALMLASANECAYALAEHVTDGDYKGFVKMMNKRAKELGCTNTHFSNPNGLPNEKHVTTARDLAIIATAAYQNEEFRKYSSAVEYTIPKTNKQDEEVLMYQHHKMYCDKKTDKYLYPYATAGKTGYTKAAGNTLVTYAEKDGRRLVCVILRSTQAWSYTETAALFDYGFNKFENVNVAENETRFDQAALTEGYALPEDREITDVQIDPEAMITKPKKVEFADLDAKVVYETQEEESADSESEETSEKKEDAEKKTASGEKASEKKDTGKEAESDKKASENTEEASESDKKTKETEAESEAAETAEKTKETAAETVEAAPVPQNGEIIYTYGGNEIGRAGILVSTKEIVKEEPAEQQEDSSAVSEETDGSGAGKAADKAKKLLAGTSLKKLASGSVILIVVIVLIIVFVVRAVRKRAEEREMARSEKDGISWDDIKEPVRKEHHLSEELPDGEPAVMKEVEDLELEDEELEDLEEFAAEEAEPDRLEKEPGAEETEPERLAEPESDEPISTEQKVEE